ncbi:MAG TPA: IS200/IS605 family transposase [Gemmatimonadales bacterium]|nr:IS200/IS605 family transposase [Gemmatimonadales bacterium]
MERTQAPPFDHALLGRWEPVYRSQLHYLVTWSTRGHRPVLKDSHADTLESLVASLCDEREFQLVDIGVGRDHVHLLLALRPTQSIATAIRELKGRSGMELLQRHPELRVWLGAHLVWDERYAVETVSGARVERVRARLRSAHRRRHDGTSLDNLRRAS